MKEANTTIKHHVAALRIIHLQCPLTLEEGSLLLIGILIRWENKKVENDNSKEN